MTRKDVVLEGAERSRRSIFERVNVRKTESLARRRPEKRTAPSF